MRRRILLSDGSMPPAQYEYVDLGLPSGLKWANMNIGATSPEDYGGYFSWGNIEPHFSSDKQNIDDGYSFDSTNYALTSGSQLPGDIPSNDAQYDAALAIFGSGSRLPKTDDFYELKINTDYEYTTINGIECTKFMKKDDHSVYILVPSASYVSGTKIYQSTYSNRYGYYTTSTRHNIYYAKFYLTGHIYTVLETYGSRSQGVPIRAVHD